MTLGMDYVAVYLNNVVELQFAENLITSNIQFVE